MSKNMSRYPITKAFLNAHEAVTLERDLDDHLGEHVHGVPGEVCLACFNEEQAEGVLSEIEDIADMIANEQDDDAIRYLLRGL